MINFIYLTSASQNLFAFLLGKIIYIVSNFYHLQGCKVIETVGDNLDRCAGGNVLELCRSQSLQGKIDVIENMKTILDHQVPESKMTCKSLPHDNKTFSCILNISLNLSLYSRSDRRAYWIRCLFLTLTTSDRKMLKFKGEKKKT